MPVSYNGKKFIFHNPDGSEIAVRGWGNQFHAIFETMEGYTIIKDSDSGFYHYATLSEDNRELVPSSRRVELGNSKCIELPKHLREQCKEIQVMAETEPNELGGKRRWEERRAQCYNKLKAMTSDEELRQPQFEGTVGKYNGLCLLVEFPDVSSNMTQFQVNDFCNKIGYNDFGNNGSVYDYFFDVSQGKLQYNNIVTTYYKTKYPRSYYTDPNITNGTRARELIVEALTSLKASGFDFSKLSSDSDGYIYALNVFYAGNCINNWREGLWPHSWSLSSPLLVTDNKKFFDYQITDIGTELTLRTFCHENGHMICQFPDLYDYTGKSNGVGHYSLMAYGGSETNPTQVDAYLKNFAGWTSKLTTITGGKVFTLPADKNEFLIYRKDTDEYFILENRHKIGRDASLPDEGVAIWHVDEQGSNNNYQMTPSKHYKLSLEQPDNRFDLERKVNYGDSEDFYGGIKTSKFGSGTTPNSKWWDGTNSGLEIEEISEPNSIMTIKTK